MNDADSDRRQNIALFRYGLIADLLQPSPDDKGLNERLAAKAALDYTIPGSTRTRVAAETLRDWLKAYRRGGFDALLPKERADRGLARALPAAAVEALLAAKEGNPKLSVQLVIREARKCADVPPAIAPAVLHRASAADPPWPDGQTQGRPGRSGSAPLRLRPGRADVDERCDARAERPGRRSAQAQDLPDRLHRRCHPGRPLRRLCPVGEHRHLPAGAPAGDRARRGLPQRLYVDNGANYRSQHLALVCAKLGIALIHARPYRPQGKGKIARWFKTIRAQLLTRLTAEDTANLAALNRRLAAWIEGEYHHTPHRGLAGLAPLEQWAQSAEGVRFPEPTWTWTICSCSRPGARSRRTAR